MIAWEGPSRIDGEPVVLIVTGLDGSSNNPKTGPMAQGWILLRDVSPLAGLSTGADVSICGGCRHRPRDANVDRSRLVNGELESYGWGRRSCYVNPMGLQTVWRTYREGKYPELDPDAFDGKLLRMGGYGDPAAVPIAVWQLLLSRCADWTGYTHQWRNGRFQRLRRYCMASVDTSEEAARARERGWRTFRVLSETDRAGHVEDVCPASPEGGHTKTCAECLQCNGRGWGDEHGPHVAIRAHGSGVVHFEQRLVQLEIPLRRVSE